MSIGFGGYRISNRSLEHRGALKMALECGVKLIDTSTNYTGGESESLIGEVLKQVSTKPTIVSKFGYIQGPLLQDLSNRFDQLSYKEEIVKVSENLWHCIAPDFIKEQLELSLSRLGLESLDVYLIHNPEYFFKSKGATPKEYYKRIQNAFSTLEELVSVGKIKSFGISSNNFILDPKHPENTHIDKVYECALNISKDHHFKWIQFPMNLIEVNALEKWYGGLSLIDKARGLELTTMINRPLNAFKDDKVIRLASYKELCDFSALDDGAKLFDQCLEILDQRIKTQDPSESVHDLAIIKQFKGLWNTLPSPDGVEQVFYGHIFPLVAKVWGGDVSPSDSQPFYDLFDLCLLYSRKAMDLQAQNFKEQALSSGLIEQRDEALQVTLVKKYLEFGVDYVLVGLKRESYVMQMKELF